MGAVTNIQRFSLTDGDGIRTTVFFKGCNMNCGWCHNPETINKKPELMFYSNKCIGCGKCFSACPVGAHKTEGGKHIIDRELCTSCGACAQSCYAEALVICGEEMTVEEVMYQVRQDKPYYDGSGGGVTLSGGEVLCQRDFAIAIADACHDEEIKVAVETNLCFGFDYARELFTKCDLIMCDLKLFDEGEHIKNTGVSNKVIVENVKKLDTLGIPFIVRTPLIPGVTDTEDNIRAITGTLKGLKNLKRYELLNFNPLGEGKYRGLDRSNAFEAARPLSQDALSLIEKVLADSAIAYKIV